jgi:hypothetical protein
MKRKVFDKLASGVGAVLVVVLLAAGGLMMWGYSFANSSVHNQLAMQQIYFPPKAAFANAKPGTEITPSMIPSVSQYAGQQLLTGQQAEAYADHFIAQHITDMSGGKTYSQLSAESMAQPTNAKLAGQVATVFKGTTLRSMLLEAYGFGTLAQIAWIAAIASYIAAGVMLVLSVLGFVHLRRTGPETEILSSVATHIHATA